MWRAKRLSLVVVVGFFLTCNVSFAKQVQYSIGPVCKNNKIVCKNPNEVPTCLKLDPKVHLELEDFVNGERINRYQPSCSNNPNNFRPKCIDTSQDSEIITEDVTLECVEYIQCKNDKDTNKLSTVCSDGKLPKCLGDDNEPNCNNETVCENNSVPVCDYTWQAYAESTSYH